MINKVADFFKYIVTLTGSVILLLILGHYILGFMKYIDDGIEKGFQSNISKIKKDSRMGLPPYKDFKEHDEFWSEYTSSGNGMRVEPYIHWRRNDREGKYVNIKNGVRKTSFKESIDKNAHKVFVFGGSTIWGTAVSDSQTIPSELQKLMGNKYNIYNFGESGYVTIQEYNYLLKLLADGNIPDIVIFYDGVNDGIAGTYTPGIPRDPQNVRQDHEKFQNLWLRLIGKTNYNLIVKKINYKYHYPKYIEKINKNLVGNAEKTVDYYLAFIRQTKALGKEYGFKSYFFWQPNILSNTRELQPYEAKILNSQDKLKQKTQLAVYNAAKKKLGNLEHQNIYFLGNQLDNIDEPMYLDFCHLGPKANQIIATSIYSKIKDEL